VPGTGLEEIQMAGITRDEVLHVARLARLDLSEDEVTKFQAQLSQILEAVSKVRELDLSDVPPTAHPLEIANAWEDDEPRPCLPVEDVFANAPDRDDGYFRSPPA
jgi:aspartyl-tRNA(Asn)/glutamyl-tRNA(Gln) amidotransferase subunit C